MYEQVEVVVHGKVQGVFFRDFVLRKAKGLHLMGEVYNRSDGTVFVVAEGPREHLQKLVNALHMGPLMATVDRLEVEWYPISYKYNSFRITEEV